MRSHSSFVWEIVGNDIAKFDERFVVGTGLPSGGTQAVHRRKILKARDRLNTDNRRA